MKIGEKTTNIFHNELSRLRRRELKARVHLYAKVKEIWKQNVSPMNGRHDSKCIDYGRPKNLNVLKGLSEFCFECENGIWRLHSNKRNPAQVVPLMRPKSYFQIQRREKLQKLVQILLSIFI